jgi:hypothetical protein
MADLVNLRARDPVKDRQPSSSSESSADFSSNFAFVILAAIISIGLIVAAYALTVMPGLDPDQVLSIFATP